jgi:hypothetical protein
VIYYNMIVCANTNDLQTVVPLVNLYHYTNYMFVVLLSRSTLIY